MCIKHVYLYDIDIICIQHLILLKYAYIILSHINYYFFNYLKNFVFFQNLLYFFINIYT